MPYQIRIASFARQFKRLSVESFVRERNLGAMVEIYIYSGRKTHLGNCKTAWRASTWSSSVQAFETYHESYITDEIGHLMLLELMTRSSVDFRVVFTFFLFISLSNVKVIPSFLSMKDSRIEKYLGTTQYY
jgi:hypothetical protein